MVPLRYVYVNVQVSRIIEFAQVFFWLLALVTTSGIISWVVLSFAFLRFFYGLKAHGISREGLPYKSPYQPFLAVSLCSVMEDYQRLTTFVQFYALGMNSLILLFSGWTSFVGGFNGTIFFTNYLNWYVLKHVVCNIFLSKKPSQ